MMMPSEVSRPVSTSQNTRWVCTPSPSSDGHVYTAGSVRVAGAAGVAPRPRVVPRWASTGIAAMVASTTRAVRMRISVVDAGQAGAGRHSLQHVTAPLDQLQELAAGSGVVAEDAEHGAGDGKRVLLLDAPHRHAQMSTLAYHRHPKRVDLVEDCLRDLVRQPLLDLEPASEHVHHARDLAQANDVAPRDVSHMALAEERQQVVLTE